MGGVVAYHFVHLWLYRLYIKKTLRTGGGGGSCVKPGGDRLCHAEARGIH